MKKTNYFNFRIGLRKAQVFSLKRTILLLFFILFFYLPGFAQLDKNTWIVGGGGTFSSVNDEFSSNTVSTEYKRTNLQLSPQIGYFIKDKLAVGLKPSIWWEKDKGLSSNSLTISESIRLDYGPFFRYYFLPKEKPFNILTEVSYQYGNVKDNYSKNRGTRNNFEVLVGQAVYFNSTVGMEFLIGYQNQQEKLTSSNNASNYSSIKKGLLVSVGFQIHLTKY
ncbi:MAG: hypothetical protein IE931_13175 [Sphingobacteriales bacterium]|nr:hypothetical protein [Sphingobacteriales bacterium]